MFKYDKKELSVEKKADFIQKKSTKHSGGENNTGIPSQLKERIEGSYGLSLNDVRVHYNSDRPARLNALAYTKGNQVEIAPGQERHLAHELGHVVQQKLGVVRANARHASGEALNTDVSLERQADEIGAGKNVEIVQRMEDNVVQRVPDQYDNERTNARIAGWRRPDGSVWWPPNGGAVHGTEHSVLLENGTSLQRIGGEGGRFVAPVGTPPATLSLAPGTNLNNRHIYRVTRPVGAKESIAIPWFDQLGGGIQYELYKSIFSLADHFEFIR